MKAIIISLGVGIVFLNCACSHDSKSDIVTFDIEQDGQYCGENKCGPWTTYYKNGKVALVENFDENGKLSGERVTFRKDGTIKHYTEWKEGSKIGQEIYFDEKGYPTQFIDHIKPTTSICDGEELDEILWEIEQDNNRPNN